MRPFALLLVTAALMAGSAAAGPGHKPDKAGPPGKAVDKSMEKAVEKAVSPDGKGRAKAKDSGDVAEELADAVFTEVERRLIREYYGGEAAGEAGGPGKAKQMPPGLAKRDALPPGLERHIEKHGTLPPGLEGRALPDDLLSRLPKRKSGYDRRVVDGDVVLIERATGVILDILEGVARGR